MRTGVLIGLVALVQGCASTDPLLNTEGWRPSGANAMNITAQVANPADLVQGRTATGGSDGGMAALAVLRLRTDHVKKLPASGVTDMQVGNTPSSGGP